MRLIDADAIQIPKTGMEVFETCRLCETAFPKVVNEIISRAPTIEPKAKVIAQVTFDEEKMREIVKEAVERFKEEYEIEPKRGEWIDIAISIIDDMQREGIIDYEQAWEFRMRARMKGADDDGI